MLTDVDPDMHFYNICHNCKYYHDENVITLDKPECMSIIPLNSRSLYANFEHIKDYLGKFKIKVKAIALSETWID